MTSDLINLVQKLNEKGQFRQLLEESRQLRQQCILAAAQSISCDRSDWIELSFNQGHKLWSKMDEERIAYLEELWEKQANEK